MIHNNTPYGDTPYEQQMLINNAYNERLLEAFTDKKTIFRISTEDMDCKLYRPEIPTNRAFGEDNTIERVCFADTIEGCFRAIPGSEVYANKRQTFYVHIPIYDDYFMGTIQDGLVAYPKAKLVPDTYLTQEVWVMDMVRVQCIAEIRAWYDASKNPNFYSVEELPVRMKLVNCKFGMRQWINECLNEHPEYTIPLYEDDENE